MQTDVFHTPATSFEGLTAKMRLAFRIWVENGKDGSIEPIDASEAPDMNEVAPLDDQAIVWSIVQDVERLAESTSA